MNIKSLATTFPSLKASLEMTNVPILALYFASSWCPDCQQSAPFVTKIYNSQQEQEGDSKKLFDLMYVSSDRTKSEMEENLSSTPNWLYVPFDNEEERSDLKRHFGACASKEVSMLGMKPEDRKSGIPTLLLIEKKTEQILTSDGISDIMGNTKVDDPLTKWSSQLSSS